MIRGSRIRNGECVHHCGGGGKGVIVVEGGLQTLIIILIGRYRCANIISYSLMCCCLFSYYDGSPLPSGFLAGLATPHGVVSRGFHFVSSGTGVACMAVVAICNSIPMCPAVSIGIAIAWASVGSLFASSAWVASEGGGVLRFGSHRGKFLMHVCKLFE